MSNYSLPELNEVSESVKLLQTIIKNMSDGVLRVTNAAGTIGTIEVADATAATQVVTKAQLDAAVASILGAASGEVVATINAISDAINDDANFFTTMATIHTANDAKFTALSALLDISQLAEHFAAFTGSTFGDNLKLKGILQLAETAIELRATIESPTFNGTTQALGGTFYFNDNSSASGKAGLSYETGTGWAKINKPFAVTGAIKSSAGLQANVWEGVDGESKIKSATKGLKVYYEGVEGWQVDKKASSSNTITITSHGNPATGVTEIMGVLKSHNLSMQGPITTSSTVDGRNVASDGARGDNLAPRKATVNFGDTTANSNFGTPLDTGVDAVKVMVHVIDGFDGGAAVKVGKIGVDDFYLTVSDLSVTGSTTVLEFAKEATVSTQLTFTLTGSGMSVGKLRIVLETA